MPLLARNQPMAVTVTAPDDQWIREFVRRVVGARLAALGHLDSVETAYRQNDDVHFVTEARAVFHTTLARLPEIERLVADQHPHEVACLAAVPLGPEGADAYRAWIVRESRD